MKNSIRMMRGEIITIVALKIKRTCVGVDANITGEAIRYRKKAGQNRFINFREDTVS